MFFFGKIDFGEATSEGGHMIRRMISLRDALTRSFSNRVQ